MKKFLAFTAFLTTLSAFTAICGAQQSESADDTTGKTMSESPNVADLNTDTQIKPLETTMSEAEKALPGNSGFSQDKNNEIPALQCSNEKLKAQVKDFIFRNINKSETNSVIENRKRILLIRNMTDFEEISPDDIDSRKEFNSAAVIAYLRINENRKNIKVCRSYGNNSASLHNIDLVIYPYLNYYNVVIANFVYDTKKIENATFVFNW